MTTKKPTKNKPVAKKRVLKPAAQKPVVKKVEVLKATISEQNIIDQVSKMLSDGYSVKMNCAGRHKMCKSGEDLLSYIRAHSPYELVGMKSGCQALAFGIK